MNATKNQLDKALSNAIELREFIETMLGTSKFETLVQNEWYRTVLSLQLAIFEEMKEREN